MHPETATASPFVDIVLDFAYLCVADADETDCGSAARAIFVDEGGGAKEDLFVIGCGQKGSDELFAGDDATGGFGDVGEEGVREGGDFAPDVVGENAGLDGCSGCESPDT